MLDLVQHRNERGLPAILLKNSLKTQILIADIHRHYPINKGPGDRLLNSQFALRSR